jgi:hypothetical protein
MPFRDVPSNVDFPAQEHAILKFWKDIRAFETMRALHKGQPRWSFIDGPITANNPMGVHHGWGRTYKDLYNRFWTMRGRELRYQNGFDCQGLWVEVEVEKELGFRSKRDIEAYGLDRFVLKCKERVLRYAAIQTEQSIRLGYWMDWNDPDQLRWLARPAGQDPGRSDHRPGALGAGDRYGRDDRGAAGPARTGRQLLHLLQREQLHDLDLPQEVLGEGLALSRRRRHAWCSRCATGISQHEIVTDGYTELTHPGVTLRFPLRERPGEALLVWTTTPWTLTSNVAAAVGPDLTYVKVRHGEHILYLSRGTLRHAEGPLRGAGRAARRRSGRLDATTAPSTTWRRLDSRVAAPTCASLCGDVRQVPARPTASSPGTRSAKRGHRHRPHRPGLRRRGLRLGQAASPADHRAAGRGGLFVAGFGAVDRQETSPRCASLIFEHLRERGLPYDVEPPTRTATRFAGAARPSWSSAWWTSGSSAWGRCMTSRATELTRGKGPQPALSDHGCGQPDPLDSRVRLCPRDGLAAQHARLDDQQEALLGAGVALLGVRRLWDSFEVIGDEESSRPAPPSAGSASRGTPPTAPG